MKKLIAIALAVAMLLTMAVAAPAAARGPSYPPGQTLPGGRFESGTFGGPNNDNTFAGFSVVATDPGPWGDNFRYNGGDNTYADPSAGKPGAPIPSFSLNAQSQPTTLRGTVALSDFGPYPEAAYFELGLGSFINEHDGQPAVYIIFFGNANGGYDIHMQSYEAQRPPDDQIYSTSGIPGADPVPPSSFRYEVTFVPDGDGGGQATLTINKTTLAPFDYEDALSSVGLFAGFVSLDPNLSAKANISAIRVSQ